MRRAHAGKAVGEKRIVRHIGVGLRTEARLHHTAAGCHIEVRHIVTEPKLPPASLPALAHKPMVFAYLIVFSTASFSVTCINYSFTTCPAIGNNFLWALAQPSQ